jgi:hypothetical protein
VLISADGSVAGVHDAIMRTLRTRLAVPKQ